MLREESWADHAKHVVIHVAVEVCVWVASGEQACDVAQYVPPDESLDDPWSGHAWHVEHHMPPEGSLRCEGRRDG